MNEKNNQHLELKAKWDGLYQKNQISKVVDVLKENHFLLPKVGRALDLACGLGENALFLAEHGLTVDAWDISLVALNKLNEKATKKQLKVNVNQVYIDPQVLVKNSFDIIVLSRFLDRSLSNAIMESLKPKGLFFYQTYSREKIVSKGPNNPEYLLARNELLTLFSPLKVVFYRENSLIGDLECGERNETLFVGQKI